MGRALNTNRVGEAMSINLVREDVSRAIDLLRSNVPALTQGKGILNFQDLAGFSPVSGLDESGVSHGRVSSVSRPEALKALAAHVLDAAVLLEANVDSVIGADGAFSQIVGSIGLSGVLGWRSLDGQRACGGR